MDLHTSGHVPLDGVSAGCRVVTVYVVIVLSPAGNSNIHANIVINPLGYTMIPTPQAMNTYKA